MPECLMPWCDPDVHKQLGKLKKPYTLSFNINPDRNATIPEIITDPMEDHKIPSILEAISKAKRKERKP